MNEEKRTRLQELAEKEESSKEKHSGNSMKAVKAKNARRKRIKVISLIAVVLILIIAGIIFGVSHFASSDAVTTEETISEESGTTESTTTKARGTTELFSDVNSTDNDIYTVTYESCRLGEMNTRNGFYYPKILVQIQNTGDKNLEIESVDFNFLDEDGNVIGNVHPSKMNSAVPDIIEPGEYSYLYSDNILTGEISEDTKYTVEPVLEIQETDESSVSYDVSDTDTIYDSDSGTLFLSGNVTNDTDRTDPDAFIHFVFLDDNGYPIGLETLEVGNLPSGETVVFEDERLFIDYAEDIASWEAYSFRNL